MNKVLLFLLLPLLSISQNQDTIIKNKIYESYFSYKFRNPLFVKYVLYKGGGDCKRDGLSFKTDNLKYSARQKDYSHSGYDIGHLANAEDFANNCLYQELTFRYYNSIPQDPSLNRGIWRSYENNIRQISKNDSLLIICGAIYGKNKLPNSEVYIPTKCFKVVKSLTTKNVLYCLLFNNDNSGIVKNISLKTLETLLKYKLPL